MGARLRMVAVAAGAAASAVAAAPGASAATVSMPSIPACSADLSDAAANARLATYNTALATALGQTYAYKRLITATAAAQAKYTRYPTTANRLAYERARATQSAYLAARTIRQVSASHTPAAVMSDGTPRRWGTYRTRAYVRGSAVLAPYVCTTVTLSSATPSESSEARTVYVAGVLPSLRAAALTPTTVRPGMGRTAILDRVREEVVTSLGGAATPIGAGSGATYSIAGFHGSLQAALAKAKL